MGIPLRRETVASTLAGERIFNNFGAQGHLLVDVNVQVVVS